MGTKDRNAHSSVCSRKTDRSAPALYHIRPDRAQRVIFLFTHYGGHSVDDLYEKLNCLHEYASAHPYLEIPPEGKKYFEDWQLQQLETLREATNLRDFDAEQLRQEQETLNSLVREVKGVEGANPYEKYGYIPAEPSFIALFTCMFIHGGWFHLLGNMFFLYLAGCSIEDLWGRPLYTGFYLLSGIAATIIHALKFPGDTQPLVGASGAIAGLMGAFLCVCTIQKYPSFT